MSLVCILGYISLFYLALCLILSLISWAVNKTMQQNLRLWKPIRSLRWFLTQPLLWLEELLENKN
ncbi:hypothetical protein DMB95_08785 [Campylobacter sp. MIT 12-8780]|uniref:hypothetical protein n=1 Tax=unclassified Campylobacter TaxID=2593542 RepID=UPI000691895F|nr:MULTISPECIES: hypothetical protein [unclassified Campylobacter]NDJ27952.1 hypothetical protein [Campylobacter sp. MIT 19-121]TQR27441.1 hypothetical protein DMB91_04075 [Campylobacter sp. MIT 97-5078]TQR40116.1 hypothetical protein DMB95_08785 [Campylobacter sp. MIT 12-8780]